MSPPGPDPAYRLHKPSRQAVVRLNGVEETRHILERIERLELLMKEDDHGLE